MQSCISADQALVMARAVDAAGPEVFSVTASPSGQWHVWYRFDTPEQTRAISGLFVRMWSAEEKAMRPAMNRTSPKKRKKGSPRS